MFPLFCVHLRFVTTGSLGKKSSILCDEICHLLRDLLICVGVIATDGERASVQCRNPIFALYRNCLDDNMSTIASRVSDRVWELADPLHLLKCQRCRLRHSLAFTRFSEKIDSMRLNLVLEVGKPLTQFGGVKAMNDAYAVSLFSMKNLLSLLLENKRAGLLFSSVWCMVSNALKSTFEASMPTSCY
jgi:hypothetical protein